MSLSSNISDKKVKVFAGVNDTPTSPTALKAGNGSHLVAQFNSLIDALEIGKVASESDLLERLITAIDGSSDLTLVETTSKLLIKNKKSAIYSLLKTILLSSETLGLDLIANNTDSTISLRLNSEALFQSLISFLQSGGFTELIVNDITNKITISSAAQAGNNAYVDIKRILKAGTNLSIASNDTLQEILINANLSGNNRGGTLTSKITGTLVEIIETVGITEGRPPYTYAWYQLYMPSIGLGTLLSGITSASWSFNEAYSGTYYYLRVATDALGVKLSSNEIKIVYAAPPLIPNFVDLFDGIDNSSVIGRTDTNGMSWITAYSASEIPKILSNAYKNSSGFTSALINLFLYNYIVEATIEQTVFNFADVVIVWVRATTASRDKGYALKFSNGRIICSLHDGFAIAGSDLFIVSFPPLLSPGIFKIKVIVNSSSMRFDVNDGQFARTVTTTNYNTQGHVGLGGNGSSYAVLDLKVGTVGI